MGPSSRSAALGQGAGNRLDAPAAGQVDDRDLVSLDVAIRGRLHLLLCRQVDPELKAAHAASFLLRHLGVDDAAARGHPLHAAALEFARMPQVILVPHVAIEHVGHRFETAVGVCREARNIVVGILGRKMVEHQERVEPGPSGLSQAAAELHARSVRGGDRFDGSLQGASGHGRSYIRPTPRPFKSASCDHARRWLRQHRHGEGLPEPATRRLA